MPEVDLSFPIPEQLPASLPVLPLRRGVLLPGGMMPLAVGRAPSIRALQAAKGGLILIATQRQPVGDPTPSDLLTSAVLARIVEKKKRKDGNYSVLVQGLTRVVFSGFPTSRPFLEATFRRVSTPWPTTAEADGLRLELRSIVEETADLLGEKNRIAPFLKRVDDPGLLVDAVAAFLDTPQEWKRDILSTHDPLVRASKVLKALIRMREAVAAQKAVQERVNTETRDMQKEFYLRRQLDAIKKELGEGGEDDELSRLKDKLDAKDLPDEVREVVERELRRLERLGNTSPERSVAIDWLGWIAEMPWNETSSVDPDLDVLETALAKSHYGLEDVKRQVVEHLAVRKFAGEGRADVLLLVGPPGVGKTSIGQAIADATGRKLLRVALGGLRDEAELRGHRRTYIGARPGRLIEGLRRANTADPVILLDEIDKLGSGSWGNPSAALLEILDPEQNHSFVDRYMEVPFDLSKALFVATANDLSKVPGPLRDRMHILNIEGYTANEKKVIAKNHLLERVARNAGLEADDVEFTEQSLGDAINGWTREAGVRDLQRVLGKAYRFAAVKKAKGELEPPLIIDDKNIEDVLGRRRFHADHHETVQQPGIATGMAWSPVGGSVLYVEASTLPGKGQLVLTGQLGDVMKESARAALTYVLSHADELGVDPKQLDNQDLHIHVPAGGIPKDGPSAGVTMFTALASLLSGRNVRGDTAMTGEATLRGRVLPVGGIKSKVLAAHRLGIRRIILPKRNGFDLHDLPKGVREEMEFILVDHMSEVFANGLEPEEKTVEAAA